MAITNALRTDVTELYVALFGRAPDADGLGYWVVEADTKGLSAVATAMYDTAPARDYYPLFLTNSEFVTSVYTNVLGRAPDAEGLAYWTGRLAALSKAGLVLEMIDAVNNYAGTDAAGLASKALFQNKVVVAEYYAVNTADGIAGATAAIANVTATSDVSTPAAIEALIGGATGQTFTLTTGADTITGTTGSDTIIGVIGDNEAGDNITTFNSYDVIDGGAGTDVLDLVVNQDYTITPDMSNVETVRIRTTDNSTASLDFQSVTGVKTIELHDAPHQSSEANIWNIGELVDTVKFTNVARSGDWAGIDLEFNDAVGTGAADTLTVQLDNAGTMTVDGGYGSSASLEVSNSSDVGIYEYLNIESTGSDDNNLLWYQEGPYGGPAGVLKKVTVTGDANLYFSFDWNIDTLSEVDASTFTGGLTMDMGGYGTTDVTVTTFTGNDNLEMGAGDDTVKTGAGDDTVNIASGGVDNVDVGAGDDTVVAGAAIVKDTADSVVGGDGTDTLSVTAAWAVAAVADKEEALFSGFEKIELSTAMAGGTTLDMANLDGIQYLILNGHDADTINGLASGATIESHVADTYYLAVNMTGAALGTADVLNWKQTSADGFLQGLDTANVETINVTLTDTNTAAHTDTWALIAPGTTTINVSGNAGLTVLNDAGNTAITSFDASGVSGAAADAAALGVTFYSQNATATATVTIKGGSGNDVLVGNAAKDTITGGAGNDTIGGGAGIDTLSGGDGADTITGGAGKDTLTGGAGADIFIYGTTATDSNGVNVDVITDFVSGTDKIDTATTVVYAGEANGYGAVLTSLTGTAYQGVLDTSTNDLYIDVDGNGLLDDADFVIHLTGVADLAQADFM